MSYSKSWENKFELVSSIRKWNSQTREIPLELLKLGYFFYPLQFTCMTKKESPQDKLEGRFSITDSGHSKNTPHDSLVPQK